MKISKEILSLIDAAVNKAVQGSNKAMQSASDSCVAEARNYFRDTEILLYNYPALKIKVAQDEEFLYDPEAATAPTGKSKDVVRFSKTGHGLDMDRYTESVKASMMRTRQEVLKIERALETIQDDKYFDIISLKYWDGMTLEVVAEALNCDVSTIYRNKNRLVNRVKAVIFGADAFRF